MTVMRAVFVSLFRHYATARAVQGGHGHYQEQSHPGQFN